MKITISTPTNKPQYQQAEDIPHGHLCSHYHRDILMGYAIKVGKHVLFLNKYITLNQAKYCTDRYVDLGRVQINAED